MEFITYSKCTTCKKAKAWLDNKKISYVERAIKEKNPTYDEISFWIDEYNIPIKKLFNTSGLKYKELHLKDKLNHLPLYEQIQLLASDGMLVKRPLLISKDKLLVGFKEKEWEDYFFCGLR